MITDILRRIILGKKERFVFKRYKEGLIDFNNINQGIGIYIHIPFCKSICPYCPYNKIIYDSEKAKTYKEALIKELALYRGNMQNKKITSVYFGGGTPTLLVTEIKEIMDYIRKNYSFKGDIGIETHPNEAGHRLFKELKEIGVNMLSLGVQTFREDILRFLVRDYGVKEIEKALDIIKEYDFQCVDIDIMTNLPGQKLEDIRHDLEKVYSYGIDQLSVYPLIIFPMTKMDKIIKEKRLSRFNEFEEKKILDIIDNISEEFGYTRSSIWTYSKNIKNRYTSVTRESFIGFGAGASSHFGKYFYLNTFNVDAYIAVLNEGKLPINIVNRMTEKERMIFWIFWRCYDGVIDEKRFKVLFQKEMKKEFSLLFMLLKVFGMVRREENKYILTQWGRFAYHFIEKQYSIHYLNNIWQKSMEQPWIEEINL